MDNFSLVASGIMRGASYLEVAVDVNAVERMTLNHSANAKLVLFFA